MPSLPAFRFHHPYSDDRRRRGITVPICLIRGDVVVEVVAKIDTGAEFCLFERSLGEYLGLEVESGIWLEHFRVAIVHYDRDLFLSPYE